MIDGAAGDWRIEATDRLPTDHVPAAISEVD